MTTFFVSQCTKGQCSKLFLFSDLINDPRKNFKWGTIIPLIGGSAIGCAMSTGSLPAFHLSYSIFKNNEVHLKRHWPTVKSYYLDENEEIPNYSGRD